MLPRNQNPDDILLTGELAEASGDPAGAEAAYRRLLALDPQNRDATAALTHLLLHQQKPDQAETLLTAALAKDPDPDVVLQVLLTANLYKWPDWDKLITSTVAATEAFGIKKIAANLKATVIIQHDARDIEKLPVFPAFAK